LDQTPIQDFEYFHWGIAPPGTPIYGLYEPAMDMFLIILDSLEHAETLKYLLVNRFDLRVCQLDLATNFKEVRIDNTCCQNWSFTKKDHLLSINLCLQDQDPVVIEEFCASCNSKDWDINNEKRWIMFCRHVLLALDNSVNKNYKKMFKILGGLLYLKEFQNSARILEMRDEILFKLYLGVDIETTKNEINELMLKYSVKV
jgi:hypothetical protein